MSLKTPELQWFYRRLHARGLDVSQLAAALNCGRSHLSQVLNGRRPGAQTWRKIVKSKLLRADELRLLGRREDGTPIIYCGGPFTPGPAIVVPDGPAPSYLPNVPRGTNSHVEHAVYTSS